MRKWDIVNIKDYCFLNTGEIKDKFFIVLSDSEKYLDIIFVFTTSLVKKYDYISDTQKVFIPQWIISCFQKDTLIVVSNIHREDRTKFASYSCDIKEKIPDNILSEILEKIRIHPTIKPYIKKMILS